jgi:hypothetical protein
MRRLKGLQRRLHVKHAERFECLAIATLHRIDDLEMLLSRLFGQAWMRDCVTVDRGCFGPVLLDEIRELPIATSAVDQLMKGIIRRRCGIQIATLAAADIDIVHVTQLAYELRGCRQLNSLGGFLLKDDPDIVEFVNLLGRVVAYDRSAILSALHETRTAEFFEGRADHVAAYNEALAQLLLD